MENRFDNKLREANRAICMLLPADEILRYEVACEIKKHLTESSRILEIGGGEGDSAEYILRYTDASVDILDVSPDMIAAAQEKLRAYEGRTRFITKDALEYLSAAESYNIIFSEWTLHNFVQEDKKTLLRAICANLRPGGLFLLMDKVYPKEGKLELLNRQLERHRYLEDGVRDEINAHERQDFSDMYRMDEEPFTKVVEESGFVDVQILDRVERDIILAAKK